MVYSLFLLVIKTSTESFWSRKEKQRLSDGHLAVAGLNCGKLVLIPSKHRDIQHIHSVQYILGGVHSIHHREEQGQLQAWPQHHAFHNIRNVHKYRDIHSVWHIPDDVHNILHTEEQGQLQPWLLAQPQLHACQYSVHMYKDIHIHILDDVHNILHTEEQGQLQPLLQVQPHACQ